MVKPAPAHRMSVVFTGRVRGGFWFVEAE